MNPLVKKEIRLLLPGFAVAFASALANLCLPLHAHGLNSLWYGLPFVACPACVLMMALGSFGAEVDAGTFALLLAQPVSRQKTWNLKLSLLALAFVSVGLMWCLCWAAQAWYHGELINWGDLLMSVSLIGLVTFSGGLWTVLLLRQVTAAFWFTLLTPGLLAVLLGTMSDWESAAGVHFATRLLEGGLLLYSVAGILFARRLFFWAQDVQWTGGTIALPRLGWRVQFRADAERRSWRPRAALVFKELQLQQSQFVAAGVLALAHLGILTLRAFGAIHKNTTLEFVTQYFWWLWLVLPLLVGCAAVAEERRLGSMGAQLCLPVRRFSQFAIKLGTVLALSVLFGAVLPALFELSWTWPAAHSIIGQLVARSQAVLPAGQSPWLADLLWLLMLADLLILPALAAGIGFVSFYGSSLSRNTLQALGPAVLGIVLLVYLAIVAHDPTPVSVRVLPGGSDYPLWQGPLIYLIGTPILLLALFVLSHRNWQSAQVGTRAVITNLLALLGAALLIVAATTTTYHCVWGKLMSVEFQGPARLAPPNSAAVSGNTVVFCKRLSDDRLWTKTFDAQALSCYWTQPGARETRKPTLLEPSVHPQFLGNVLATEGAS